MGGRCCQTCWAWNRKIFHGVWAIGVFLIATYMNQAGPDGAYLPTMIARQVKWTDPACFNEDADCINGMHLAGAGPALSSVSDWMWRMSFTQKWNTVTSMGRLAVSNDWFATSVDTCRAERHGQCHASLLFGYCACSCKHDEYPFMHNRACLTTTEFDAVIKSKTIIKTANGAKYTEKIKVEEHATVVTSSDRPGSCGPYHSYYDHVSAKCLSNINSNDAFQIVDGFSVNVEQYQRGKKHASVHSCKQACHQHNDCKMFSYGTTDGICTLMPDLLPTSIWRPTCNAAADMYSRETCAHYVGWRVGGMSLHPGHTVEGGTAFKKVEIGVTASSHERLLKCQTHCRKHKQCSGAQVTGNTCVLLTGEATIKIHNAHDVALRHCPDGLGWSEQGICAAI